MDLVAIDREDKTELATSPSRTADQAIRCRPAQHIPHRDVRQDRSPGAWHESRD